MLFEFALYIEMPRAVMLAEDKSETPKPVAEARTWFSYRGYDGFETSQGLGGLHIPKGHVLYGKNLGEIPFMSNERDILGYRHLPLSANSREELYELQLVAARKRIEAIVDRIIEFIEMAAIGFEGT